MSDILACFSSHYSIGSSILTLEEAGKTKPGNPTSICDITKAEHLKQVILIDDRIDGFFEAYKNLGKPFKPTVPVPLETLLKDKKYTEAEAKKVFDGATVKYARESQWSTEPSQLLYGIKIVCCADHLDKTEASLLTESSVVIFVRNTQGYSDLIRIWNRAWTENFYHQGRTSWSQLKEYWTPNLMLALPFFSSFVAKNTMSFSSIVPDFPVPKDQVWVLKETESGLPFASLIDNAIDQFIAQSGSVVQYVKTIYYRDKKDFATYQTFRAIHNHGEFSHPQVSHLASNQFCWEHFKEITC